MEYRKESHFIVAYEGEKLKGKWDILTNEYIGVKGGVLKSKSPAFVSGYVEGGMHGNIYSAYCMVNEFSRWGSHPFTPALGRRLEEVISVGLNIDHDWRLWVHMRTDTTPLNKQYVQYINENYDGTYCLKAMQGYKIYIKYNGLLAKCNGHVSWAIEALNIVENSIPTDFVQGMILRGIHEKVFVSYNGTTYGDLINHWYHFILALDDKLEVKHNILTNYTILQWLYSELKNANFDKALHRANDQPWLYYENDNYVVYPLLSRRAFHEEAEAQRNCVERLYLEKVADGETHVVVVRLKNNPTQSYITCEVTNNGRINQFYYKCNRQVTEREDLELQQDYQNHLLSSLNSMA